MSAIFPPSQKSCQPFGLAMVPEVERLKIRFECYRSHHSSCLFKYEQICRKHSKPPIKRRAEDDPTSMKPPKMARSEDPSQLEQPFSKDSAKQGSPAPKDLPCLCPRLSDIVPSFTGENIPQDIYEDLVEDIFKMSSPSLKQMAEQHQQNLQEGAQLEVCLNPLLWCL